MLKKILFITILMICGLTAGFVWLQQPSETGTKPLSESANAELWIMTDPHFISSKIHDNGDAFQEIQKSSAGKELLYQEESLQAFVAYALAEKPSAIIITGDLTLNGEKKSAEHLQVIFQPLKEANIAFYCLPGNHDIHDGWARSYQGNRQEKTPQISPNDFRKIFYEGFEMAESIDEDSLSYSISLSPDYRLILLDTNVYTIDPSTRPPTTGGQVKAETMTWLTDQLKQTQNVGQTPIVLMHHNLYKHNDLVNKGYILKNASEVKSLFTEYRVPLVFSGHIHAQDILGDEKNTDAPVEIVNSSFALSDQAFGRLTLSKDSLDYQRDTVDVAAWATKKGMTDPNLLNYAQYAKEYFLSDSRGMAYGRLMEQGIYEDEILDPTADLIAELNWRFFTGRDQYTSDELDEIRNSKAYQNLQQHSQFLQDYVESIMQDQTSDHVWSKQLR